MNVLPSPELRSFVCQPNIHWEIHPYTTQEVNMSDLGPASVWAQEDASWFGRTCSCWSPGCRATTYRILEGTPSKEAKTAPDSAAVYTHSKGVTFGQNTIVLCSEDGPVRCPCCCFLPYLETRRGNTVVGRTQYICDACLFVPKFSVNGPDGKEVYRIRPDTCIFGACVRCKCGGPKGRCCRVPFIIRDPTTHQQIEKAEIVDLWAGLKAECCTKKNLYAVVWPSTASTDMRAVLTGSTLLIDITLVEQEQ